MAAVFLLIDTRRRGRFRETGAFYAAFFYWRSAEQMSQTFVVSRIETNAVQARQERLNGRDYLVVPAVAIVEGVLNGVFAPRDEIAAYVDAWNGRPFVLNHPQAGGQYISANSPRVLEAAGLGFLFDARMDGDRLHCDLWLDVAKATAQGGDALQILSRFQAGQPLELSTGYYADVEEAPGEFNGKPYSGIYRNIRPDHIAALPNDTGACSWQDGCGAPRVHQTKQQCDCGHHAASDPVTGKDLPMEEQDKTPINGADEEVAEVKAEAIETPAVKTEPAAQPVKAELPAEVVELTAMVKELGGVAGVKEALRSIQANAARSKADMIARITANRQCAFTAEQLQAMPADHLEALERSLRPTDYAARGVAANQSWYVAGDQESEWEDYVLPVAAGQEGN